MNEFSSQITFLNFREFEKGKNFLSQVLGLEEVYNIGWAVVYRTAGKAYLGAVEQASTGCGPKEGLLISLTTDDAARWHHRLERILEVSPIKEVPDAGLKSFFFTGPEGYRFEIQQFEREGLARLF